MLRVCQPTYRVRLGACRTYITEVLSSTIRLPKRIGPLLISAHTVSVIVLSDASAEIPHSPEAVYRLWSDPSTWPAWDPDVAAVEFSGPVIRGSSGRMRPTSGPETTFTVTELVSNRSVTDVSGLPGAALWFHHEVMPRATGSVASVTVGITGPLRAVWKLILGRTFRESAQRNLNGLREYLGSA